jgi:3-hydroxyisobutyrate dehydrogenase-like beta-hydroxyacid dehydrogenase
MDVEMMEGSVLEAMAEAVEQAACVIVCLSPEYKVRDLKA